jgi:CheY-like chemotaxis protein/HPt (histidine-containing phosphotransfer) domain-containing protein
MNLVGNAIKFTERGQVRLRVTAHRRGEAVWAGIDVADTGIGMTSEQISRLFQPFSQADGSMTRKYGGTGLGLAISKRLVGLMGGMMEVTSRPSMGSTFSVWVDGGSADASEWVEGWTESMFAVPPSEEEKNVQFKMTGRILLAEDGYDNQQLISLHLRSTGLEVVVADDGAQAVQRLCAEPFNLVLMDMQMPVLDGYGAASQLRAKGFTLPIIALTAHAMSGDREKCLSAGCTDYLTKPIDRDVLLRTVCQYLKRSEVAGASVPKKQDSSASPGPAPAAKGAPIVPVPSSNSPDMLAIIEGFISRLPSRVDSLRKLLDSQSLEELRRVVHQLKGAGSGYGLPQVTEYAARAEQCIKNGGTLEKVKRDVDELVQLIRRVQGYQVEFEAYGRA